MKESGFVPDLSAMPKPDKPKKRKAQNDIELKGNDPKRTKRQQAIFDKMRTK